MANVVYPKYYKNSNEPCAFVVFGLIWAIRAVLTISAILLSCLNFEGVFSCFYGRIKYIITVSAHCSIRTKTLINIKVRKISIFTLNYTFLGQNRLALRF